MPPEPPRRKPTSPSLHDITEEVAPGAIHELRPVTASTDTATTARPPPPDHRPFPRSTLAGIRVPTLAKPPPLPAAEPDEPTLHGLGPQSAQEPEPDDGDRKSAHEAIQSADRLAAELAARSAELAKARAELEAERRKPAPTPSLVPPAQVDQYERKLERKAHELPGDGSIKVLLLKLLATITGLAAALTVTVQLVNVWLEPRVKNVEAKVNAQEIVTKPLPAAAASADKSADACRDWARAYDDYNRQVLSKAGIIIPERDNAPPVTPIELDQTPLPRSGKITSAPLVRIKTKPPPLP